jgi:hypothetical protein
VAGLGKTTEAGNAAKLQQPSGTHQPNNTSKPIMELVVTSVSPSDTTSPNKAGGTDVFPANVYRNTDCSWPADTVIDKRSLFVYLTNDELRKLGVFIEKNSMYYYNKAAGGTATHTINTRLNTERFTTYDFNLVYVSDTACNTYPWGHKFYNRTDVLVPVVASVNNRLHILWFNSRYSFFDALPERYRQLQNTYANLKCAKQKNPWHQFVNYWDTKRNTILDSIHYLRLTKAELQNIGVEIMKDSISMVDTYQKFSYQIGPKRSFFRAMPDSKRQIAETPGMFPVMITDTKGLNLASFGRWVNKQRQQDNQFSDEIFNTLIAVRFPVSDFIVNRKYTIILWYYPTEEFLKALPQRYRNDIKSEIESIRSGEQSGQTSCTYFEACKSTLAINDLKVYPNPASISATLEFTLSADVIGKISLVNISGSELKILVPKTRFMSGLNSFQLQFDQVIPGIYLISIVTDKGFKTKRMIITK